jgi:hypothetical protein
LKNYFKDVILANVLGGEKRYREAVKGMIRKYEEKRKTEGIWTTKKIYIFLHSTIGVNILMSIHIHRTGKISTVVVSKV